MAKKAVKSRPKQAPSKARTKIKTKARTRAKPVARMKRSAMRDGSPDFASLHPGYVRDPLDDFIDAAARALGLPVEPQWLPAIKTNLHVTLRQAALVTDFALPDDAEPAPVFEA